MRYEYIASGWGNPLSLKDILAPGQKYDETRRIFDKFNSILEKDKLSILFNALTEKNIGIAYNNHYKQDFDQIYSDSGGLQMVTLKKKFEKEKHKIPELKDEVYKMQALNSDVAACFDEISPMLHVPDLDNSAGQRTQMSHKTFLQEGVQVGALATCKNIKRQIEIFKRHESNTKIMLICQGNKAEDFAEYH